ncbi:MAG: hypothetical protein WC477_04475 [Patescibacteria group bacterium]
MKLSNYSDFARVVIIDDNKDEGNGIKEALEAIQIPSLFFQTISNRSLENKSCSNVRLVFLDLMFSDSRSTNAAQNAGNALSKLSKIIGKTGFYILVIWSSHTTEEVASTFLQQMERQTDFAKPYTTLTLQKTDFKTSTGKFKIKSIIKKINDQLALTPSLQVFSDWERLATDSISDLAGNIAGQKNHDDLSKTINSLSEAYAGNGRPKDTPQNALMAFNEIFKGTVSQKIVANGFGNLYKKIAAGTLDDSEKAKLNTILIFTPDINPGPGSIFKIRQTTANKKQFIADIIDKDEASLGTAYAKIIPIAVEITPLCNAAQKNGKHTYFLNGLIHPSQYPTNGGANKKDIPIRKDYCYTLGKSFWNDDHGETFKLSFNLKLFHSTLSDKYIPLKKKIRDNFVIDLQHQISGYISRPGHILLS